MKRKGQTFVFSAIIFSSLIVLVHTSSLQQVDSPSLENKRFFESSLDEAPAAFNEGLENNYSRNTVKQELYSYNRVLDRTSKQKGIDFGSSQFLVLPEKGEALFINYRNSSEQANIYLDGSWDNSSIESKQNREYSFSSGKVEASVELPDRNFEKSFNASSPRLMTLMRMNSDNQKWVNSQVD